VLAAPLRIVSREVLVRVAPAVGADDPDLLAAQRVTQRLERRDLVHHPHDPPPASRVLAMHDVLPVAAHATVHRHELAERVVRDVPCAGESTDHLERFDDGLVGRIAAELEDVEQPDQAAPVMVGVGRLQRRLDSAAVQRPGRLELMHELAQRLLTATDGREHNAADGAIGRGQRRLGDPEEDVLLTADALEGVDELLDDLALCARTDPVDRRDEQVHERVGDLALAFVQQRGHERQTQRDRTRAQMRRGLDRRPGAPAGDDVRRDVSEHTGTDANGPDGEELVDLGQHRVQADVAARLFDPAEHRMLAFHVDVARADRVVFGVQQRCDPLSRVVTEP